jgi:hypothetical protein
MSKKLDKYVGKTYLHPSLYRVEVVKKVPKSRTMLVVKVIDKGKGWDEGRKRYTGIKVGSGWMRGQNYSFGQSEEVHYNTLEIDQEEDE